MWLGGASLRVVGGRVSSAFQASVHCVHRGCVAGRVEAVPSGHTHRLHSTQLHDAMPTPSWNVQGRSCTRLCFHNGLDASCTCRRQRMVQFMHDCMLAMCWGSAGSASLALRLLCALQGCVILAAWCASKASPPQ